MPMTIFRNKSYCLTIGWALLDSLYKVSWVICGHHCIWHFSSWFASIRTVFQNKKPRIERKTRCVLETVLWYIWHEIRSTTQRKFLLWWKTRWTLTFSLLFWQRIHGNNYINKKHAIWFQYMVNTHIGFSIY